MSTAAAPPTTLERVLPWVLRAGIVVLPFTLGAHIEQWLDDASDAAALFGTVAFWAVWGLSLIASVVPLPVTLTLLRVTAPAGFATALFVAIDHGDAAFAAASIVSTALVAAFAFHPVIGDVFVDGSSYGDERRFLLRYPGQLLLGPIEFAWTALVASLIAGPLLLVTQRWVLGAILTLVGAAVVFFAWRSLHALHRRWTVMVPAGFVLHDAMTLREPELFGRNKIAQIGLAPADFDGEDLRNLALGLALRAELRSASDIFTVANGGEASTIESFAFAPNRPGAVLREAKARRLPIG